jgi:GDP-L-fucose synthase
MIITSTLFNFFKDKKVLVCGASGMTGHNLYDYLKANGINVSGTTHSKCIPEFIQCDFTKFDDALRVTKDIDYVFICCAKTYNAQTCMTNPQSMILPNIQMVSNILEASLRNKVKRALYISSATVYQPSFKVLSEEDLDWNENPAHIYMGVGWVKRYLEKLCEFYTSIGLPVSVIRPTNIYGKYDKSDEKFSHVVPALIQRALKKESIFKVYGNGLAVKDFIYVDDLVRDTIKLLMSGYTQPVNICSEIDTTIKDLANTIVALMGYCPKIEFTSNTIDNVPYKRISRRKFDALFGRDSYTPLVCGLEETIKWFS